MTTQEIFDWLEENSSHDFLGTGSNSKSAYKEEKEWWKQFNILKERFEDLEQGNQKLKNYVGHKNSCDITLWGNTPNENATKTYIRPSCTCGLDELLNLKNNER